MRYFPVHLNLEDKTAVIIGGGAVAERKCNLLLDAGAKVCIISPVCTDPLLELFASGSISLTFRKFAGGEDLSGASLVFAATDDADVNNHVYCAAHFLGIPVDRTDDPGSGDFITPAILRRGDLLITVSTSGKSPVLAQAIRQELSEQYGEEYGKALHILGAVREKLLTVQGNTAYNKKLLNVLVGHNVPEMLKNNGKAHLNLLLLKIFGPGFSLDELGIGDKDFS